MERVAAVEAHREEGCHEREREGVEDVHDGEPDTQQKHCHVLEETQKRLGGGESLQIEWSR